ncbi:hypothetical protein TWF481_001570 [Arthrobotrys musiformis]|uniref:LisH domain-containing protein n=1 Tax=Arthrobotrys musiformis TaxID=47236 RepID=A0AAV9VZQ4_9PEZI
MNNLNQMTSLAVGGVQVSGGMPNMAQAPQNPNMSNGSGSKGLERSLLNTYIYDYFIRHDMFESARAILQEAEVSTEPGTSARRGSPSRRSQKHDPDGNLINGIDDSMDSDRKDDEGSERGADLPLPKVPQDSSGGSFLYDWWSLFWDIFGARTGKAVSGPAMTYVNQVQVQAKSREQQQRLIQITQASGLMAGQIPQQFMAGYPANQMLRVPNGVIHAEDVLQKNNLARQAMVNNQRNKPQFPQNPNQQQQQLQQQLKTQQQQQQAMIQQQQQMQRDQSVDGERPQSPAPGQNGSSPSKRARHEGEFQPGAGRGQLQNMPAGQANAQAMLMHHGINQLTPGQFAQFNNANPAVQAKLTAAYAQNLRMAQAQQQNAVVNAAAVMGNPALTKGVMPNGQMAGVSAAHGTPMVHQTSADGGQGINEYYNGGMGRGGINATEQDQIHMRGNEPRPDGTVPFQSQSVSPSGTRAAPSPQPSADIKRGTPKMGAQPGPGSPLPSDSNIQIQRGSPAASMAAFSGQPTIQNAAMMRPPSSHPGFPGVGPHMNEQAMNPALRQQAQAGRGQPMWAGGPMAGNQTAQAAQAQMAQLQAQAQNQGQPQGQAPQVAPSPAASAGQPQNIGTPGQARPGVPHQAMPPPSAPANQNAGRTSPQVNAMPPTPTNKAGGAARKKDTKGDRKQSRPNKKAAAGAAAAANAGAAGAPTPSEAETPAPDTPMTPQNPNSFNAPGNVAKVQGGFQNTAVPVAGGAASEVVPNPAAAVAPPMAATESSENPNFGMMTNMDGFGGIPNENELMEFDFESFLNPEATTAADLNFDFSAFGSGMDDVTLDGGP